MQLGTEWLVEAIGCRPDALRDLELLRRLLGAVIDELQLKVVGPDDVQGDGAWHRFPPPGGVTGLYLLTESHLACHTYPEEGAATFNLYCCRARPPWPWSERLAAILGAREVRVRVLSRP